MVSPLICCGEVRPTLLLNRPQTRSFGVIDSKAFKYQLALVTFTEACGMPNITADTSGIKGQGMSKLGREWDPGVELKRGSK